MSCTQHNGENSGVWQDVPSQCYVFPHGSAIILLGEKHIFV